MANYIGQGWSAVMGIVFVPLYVSYLGIEAYGLIGLFALLQAWLRLLDMGMTPTLVREMARFTADGQEVAEIRDLLRSFEMISIALAVLTALTIGMRADWLAESWLRSGTLPTDTVAGAITVMGTVAAIRFIESVYRSCLVGLQRQVTFNLINSGMATLRGVGAVAVLALVSPTVYAFFVWQGIVSIASLGMMALATYSSIHNGDRGGRFSTDSLRSVWQFAGGMLGINLLALLLTQVDKILLSKMLPLADFGYYSLAAAAAGAIFMLVAPITQAFYPRLTQLHASSNDAGMARAFHQGAQMVTVMLGSAAVVLMFYSDTFLSIWTQDAVLTERTAPLLSLLVLGNLFNGLMWIPYQTQLAHGWTSLAMRINLVAVAIIVPAILWVTPRYGAAGAGLIWCCLNAGYLTIAVHFMHRRILTKEKRYWYLQDVLQPLIAATLVVMLIRWSLPTPQNATQQLASLIAATILALMASILAAPLVRRQVGKAWISQRIRVSQGSTEWTRL
ncbi:MAG: oligosaccharide flippase family protein [Planctomycetaceae bacterium]